MVGESGWVLARIDPGVRFPTAETALLTLSVTNPDDCGVIFLRVTFAKALQTYWMCPFAHAWAAVTFCAIIRSTCAFSFVFSTFAALRSAIFL